jgi:mannose/fructose/N-acetylgalactosamine-specific phosphotransferase system component IIC
VTLTAKQKKVVLTVSAITVTGALVTFIYFTLKNKKKKEAENTKDKESESQK